MLKMNIIRRKEIFLIHFLVKSFNLDKALYRYCVTENTRYLELFFHERILWQI